MLLTLYFQIHLSYVVASVVLSYTDVDAGISDLCTLYDQCPTLQQLVA